MKPVFTATLDAGQVTIGWTKQGMDGVKIWVDRGNGKGFAFLAVDTVQDYTDTAALPPAGHKVRSGNTMPSTGKATTASANGTMSSASRWRGK